MVLHIFIQGITASCFPAGATVRVANGRKKRMCDVEIGDSVWDGQNFTEVFMICHADEAATTNYVEIDGMRCTKGHYVLTRDAEGTESLKAAEDVEVGDLVQDTDVVPHAISGWPPVKTSVWRPVRKVCPATLAQDGIFSPLTMSGKLTVDGITCSAYTTTNPPETFIPATAPVRALYRARGAEAVKRWEAKVWDRKTARPRGFKAAPKTVTGVKVNSLPLSMRTLTARPEQARITAAQRLGGKMHYIMECTLKNGDTWMVAKRYSEFLALHNALSDSPHVAGLSFPAKTWGSGNDTATVAQRMKEITTWSNAMLENSCRCLSTDKALRDFLGEKRVIACGQA